MRRAFSTPVGKASRLAALAVEPATLTRPVRRPARLLSLVVLAATLVLGGGTALAQTITISPTTAQTLQEGNSLSFTMTVTNAAANHVGYLNVDWESDSITDDDFAVYQQATAPTSSDTPLTFTTDNRAPKLRFTEVFSVGNAPSGAVTYWFLAKTDTSFLEADETFRVNLRLWTSDFSSNPLTQAI